MSVAKKYLFNEPITPQDEAALLADYRETPSETLSDWLNDRKQAWFDMKRDFPGLRPDENQGNHPQEYKMRVIEMEIRLMETVLNERSARAGRRASVPRKQAGIATADSAFWRDLEAQFRALPDPNGELTATFNGGQWRVYGGPNDDRQRARLQSLFRSLARRGGLAAGRPSRRSRRRASAGRPNRPNALDAWLNLLREESPLFHRTEDTRIVVKGAERRHRDQGWIENLTLASADYCVEQATRAFSLETAAKDEGSRRGADDVTRERRKVGRGSVGRASGRKGDPTLLRDRDAVTFRIAEQYLGISERQRQNLIRSGGLQVIGKGQNRRITTESLRSYLPPENPK